MGKWPWLKKSNGSEYMYVYEIVCALISLYPLGAIFLTPMLLLAILRLLTLFLYMYI